MESLALPGEKASILSKMRVAAGPALADSVAAKPGKRRESSPRFEKGTKADRAMPAGMAKRMPSG